MSQLMPRINLHTIYSNYSALQFMATAQFQNLCMMYIST